MVCFAKLDYSEDPDDWRKEIVQIPLMNVYEKQENKNPQLQNSIQLTPILSWLSIINT